VSMKTKLPMPVLAMGGDKSFGANEAVVMRNAATDVTELVILGAGHCLMEEVRRRRSRPCAPSSTKVSRTPIAKPRRVHATQDRTRLKGS
jgi:hypothetical protein